MQVRYVGNRAFKNRLAEITYSDQEEQKAFQIFDMMNDLGWNIDTSVENWAACNVEDRQEYDLFINDMKQCKKKLNLR